MPFDVILPPIPGEEWSFHISDPVIETAVSHSRTRTAAPSLAGKHLTGNHIIILLIKKAKILTIGIGSFSGP